MCEELESQIRHGVRDTSLAILVRSLQRAHHLVVKAIPQYASEHERKRVVYTYRLTEILGCDGSKGFREVFWDQALLNEPPEEVL